MENKRWVFTASDLKSSHRHPLWGLCRNIITLSPSLTWCSITANHQIEWRTILSMYSEILKKYTIAIASNLLDIVCQTVTPQFDHPNSVNQALFLARNTSYQRKPQVGKYGSQTSSHLNANQGEQSSPHDQSRCFYLFQIALSTLTACPPTFPTAVFQWPPSANRRHSTSNSSFLCGNTSTVKA